jgi:hypothetical protein
MDAIIKLAILLLMITLSGQMPGSGLIINATVLLCCPVLLIGALNVYRLER